MMKLAIMQPYLFPYIGYFQLMNAVDEFVVYDNIEYTKKGWINRNRILVNGKDSYISFPLKNDSDYLNINERYLADSWVTERKKILNKISESYKKSPNYNTVFPIIEKAVLFQDTNLFLFILHSLNLIREYLEIQTPLTKSSSVPIEHTLKAEKKVIGICKSRNADTYVNPIGGVDLYSKEQFKMEGIDLYFLKSKDISYKQYNNQFVPWLSIIDVLMFNSKDEIKRLIDFYTFQ